MSFIHQVSYFYGPQGTFAWKCSIILTNIHASTNKGIMHSVMMLSAWQAQVKHQWLNIWFHVSNYLGIYFFLVNSILVYNSPIILHGINLFIEKRANQSFKKICVKGTLLGSKPQYLIIRKCKLLKLLLGFHFFSFYISIVIQCPVTESTYFCSWKLISLSVWSRYIRAELYLQCAYILKWRCVFILVIWLYICYDFDLIRRVLNAFFFSPLCSLLFKM